MTLNLRDANGLPIVNGPGAPLRDDVTVNEISYAMTAEGRLYAGFARHYLMTYFPNAYPRWYLEGFGEMFATFYVASPSEIDYGQRPEGFSDVMHRYGRVPVRDILDGKYLDGKPSTTAWTPYHAWALVHLLFFSEEWQEPLHKYLQAVARGASEAEAAAALGDIDKLQKELAGYRGKKVPYEKLTYPPERTPPPEVRQLEASEAALVRGRLELGARVEIPPAPPPGTDPKTAERMERNRAEALEERQAWLARLRDNAARYPKEASGQLLLAEAECRSDFADQCLAAAERALALLPKSPDATAWRGVALAKLAVAGPPAERERKLRAARKLIIKANRADPEAVQPLLGYYRSFTEAGEAPPQAAVAGLMKVVDSVPAAPAPRVMLGANLANQGDIDGAKRMLRPVAVGAYDSPEKPTAESILERLPTQDQAGKQPSGR
jgi:tetratricopeptide (TPR) repeat protein